MGKKFLFIFAADTLKVNLWYSIIRKWEYIYSLTLVLSESSQICWQEYQECCSALTDHPLVVCWGEVSQARQHTPPRYRGCI